jgi:hypothetical protein
VRTLADLLNSPEGLRFLESRGVYVSQQAFKDRLQAAVKPNLTHALGLEGTKLVYAGQQLYVDYRQSVLSKISTLRDLEQDDDLSPFFLWVDTDRSGSDSLMTKLAWSASSKKGSIRIVSKRTNGVEARFVQLDEARLQRAMDKLVTHLLQLSVRREGAKRRYQQLRAIFVRENPGTLSEFNYRLTTFLLDNQLDYNPRPVILSEVLNQGIITDEVNLFINHLPVVVQVFNQAVYALIEMDIDPQVKPLSDDYLPLSYSCEVDNQRLRLNHEIEGDDHFAVATCRCGASYKFYLGRNTLSMAEIAQTNRWSPDVCLPVFLNDLVSGYVVGKSSALYGLVLNAVLEKALHKRPVPMFVPPSLAEGESTPDQVDSMIYSYIHG